MGFGAMGRRLFEDIRCDPAVLLDSARIKCDLGSTSGPSLQFPGRPVVGESQCIGKEGFLHSRRDSLCRPRGGFPSSDSPNFWVRGLEVGCHWRRGCLNTHLTCGIFF